MEAEKSMESNKKSDNNRDKKMTRKQEDIGKEEECERDIEAAVSQRPFFFLSQLFAITAQKGSHFCFILYPRTKVVIRSEKDRDTSQPESKVPTDGLMYYFDLSVYLDSGCWDSLSSPVKQYIQNLLKIDPSKYKGISSGFGVLLKEQGVRGFFRGWVPTLLGYSAQGACKYGFDEYFKKYYTDLAGPENAAKYKTLIFLAGSASAQVIADVALCPFEAVKVCVQTQPGLSRGLSDGLPKFVRAEGAAGLYKVLVPLWGRQIPYTMMKFASFETIVEQLYKNVIPTPKDQCSKSTQLGVSFAGGYLAGILCAIVSHPAEPGFFPQQRQGGNCGRCCE